MFLTPVVNMIQTIVNKKVLAKESRPEDISWAEIEAAFEDQALITGYLDHQVQKGYVIRFGDIVAFSPRYQFDLCEYNVVPDIYINTPIEFSILKVVGFCKTNHFWFQAKDYAVVDMLN